jgi:LCP family protein required for cell wall assembly
MDRDQQSQKKHLRKTNNRKEAHAQQTISRRKQRFRMNLITGIFVGIFVLAVGGIFYNLYKSRSGYQSTGAGENSGTGAYRHVTYQDKQYEYNTRVTTILYVGIDSLDKLESSKVYGQAPRSDAFVLAVLDEYSHTMTMVALNRNTMTDIQQYDLSGNKTSKVNKQLAYAFAEGEGGKESCKNTVSTISSLLGNIPIDYYAVMNRDAIPYMNELAGGVTVTVPDDELAGEYPELYKGNTVTLDGEQAVSFLRYRDTDIAYSNSNRMERQKTYVNAFINTVKSSVKDNAEDTWEKINDSGINDYMMTDIKRNQYINLINSLNNVDLDNTEYYMPDGTNDNSKELEEFYVDETALYEKILDICYLEE